MIVFSITGSIFIALIILFILFLSFRRPDIRLYKHYINICKKLIQLYKEETISKSSPFFSICIPVYNMEKYIEKSILSVLNQSFRNFEIVIINDFSHDNSEKIIRKLQYKNSRIRLINNQENLGIYKARVEAIKNSKGKYLIFLDSDDLFSNPELLNKLYDFNSIYNEDIIEFNVIIQEEEHILYYSHDHRISHNHHYKQEFIFQPYLSNILFFENNEYSDIFCRCIWNKMVRKEIFQKTINFLGIRTFKKKHFDYAEDTIINIVNFEYSSNFSNLNLIGYMYNVRKDSISHINKRKEINFKIGCCLFFFYKLLFKYINYFKKDINYLFFDIKAFDYYFNYIKEYSSISFEKKAIINFYQLLINLLVLFPQDKLKL
jgi:glycosyltransferase involved in cell wall biosynthesis